MHLVIHFNGGSKPWRALQTTILNTRSQGNRYRDEEYDEADLTEFGESTDAGGGEAEGQRFRSQGQMNRGRDFGGAFGGQAGRGQRDFRSGSGGQSGRLGEQSQVYGRDIVPRGGESYPDLDDQDLYDEDYIGSTRHRAGQRGEVGRQGYGNIGGRRSGQYSREGGYDSGNYGQESGLGSTSMGKFGGRGPKNYRRSNERITEEINDRLTDHADINAEEVEVSVQDGEVTLSGTIDDRFAKRLAEDVAWQVGGVTEVNNHLRVKRSQSGSESTTGESSGSGTAKTRTHR